MWQGKVWRKIDLCWPTTLSCLQLVILGHEMGSQTAGGVVPLKVGYTAPPVFDGVKLWEKHGVSFPRVEFTDIVGENVSF